MIRRAVHGDVADLLRIKRALRLGRGEDRGGFLLGTDAAGYRHLIGTARVWVLEAPTPVGFAVTWPDAALRASEVWQRAADIAWVGLDPSQLDGVPIGYFDQLAVLPGVRIRLAGAVLALHALVDLFADHEHVFATTVVAPIRNTAALRFLSRVGAGEVGRIDEVYPGVGSIVSAVHHVTRSRFEARLAEVRARGRASEQRVLREARGR